MPMDSSVTTALDVIVGAPGGDAPAVQLRGAVPAPAVPAARARGLVRQVLLLLLVDRRTLPKSDVLRLETWCVFSHR